MNAPDPMRPFLTGMGQSNLSRSFATPQRSGELLDQMLQSKLGPTQGQQFFQPTQRQMPDRSMFEHKLNKPAVTNAHIDAMTNIANELIRPGITGTGGGGTPTTPGTVPGPTSVNPGVPGSTGTPWADPGGRTYGGEQTPAFDRPTDYDPNTYMQSRGGTTPAFDRPGNGTPMDRGTGPAFDRPSSGLPGDNQMRQNPWGGLPPYVNNEQSMLWRNLVQQFGPVEGPRYYDWYMWSQSKGPLGGPAGQASGSTGLGPGNQGPDGGNPY